jgi:cytochrome c-type biogenesis protein CcmH/NrfG
VAKTNLKEYMDIIETLIKEEQFDEALSHCRHILETFPKHVDTYRLMGKTYLESKQFEEAGDLFQRVLSSTPDDFISHVGMSIIREEVADEAAAIWHMERAFEAQPSNRAVQDELRRLYDKKDGFAPAKVRLTRGALARMYSHGDLYNQAITELTGALEDDPNRPDLEVLLAEMYYKTEQLTDSLEASTSLLDKLPHSLSANLLIAQIFSETEREDEAQAYLSNARELDPYSSLIGVESIADDHITIEKLAYVAPVASDVDESTAEDAHADTEDLLSEDKEILDTTESEEAPERTASADDSDTVAEALPAQDVPEWLRELLPEDEAEAEKSLATAQAAGENPEDPEEASDRALESPEWFKEEDEEEKKEEAKPEDPMAWLDDMVSESESRRNDPEPASEQPALEDALNEAADGVEDETQEVPSAVEDEISEEIQEVLSELSENAITQEEKIPGNSAPVSEEDDETPDWLKDFVEEAEQSTQPSKDFQTESLLHAPDWLDEFEDEITDASKNEEADELVSSPELKITEEVEVEFEQPASETGEAERLEEVAEEENEEKEEVRESANSWIPESTFEEIEEPQLAAEPIAESSATQTPEITQPAAVQSSEEIKTARLNELLENARQAFNYEKLDEGLKQYRKLIPTRTFTDEVIADLQAALSKYPKHVGLWQTLGDAYVRKDQLRDALESYTKAEDLL